MFRSWQRPTAIIYEDPFERTMWYSPTGKLIISLFLKILTDIHLGSKMFIFSLVARALRQSHCCPAQRVDYAGHRQQRAG